MTQDQDLFDGSAPICYVPSAVDEASRAAP